MAELVVHTAPQPYPPLQDHDVPQGLHAMSTPCLMNNAVQPSRSQIQSMELALASQPSPPPYPPPRDLDEFPGASSEMFLAPASLLPSTGQLSVAQILSLKGDGASRSSHQEPPMISADVGLDADCAGGSSHCGVGAPKIPPTCLHASLVSSSLEAAHQILTLKNQWCGRYSIHQHLEAHSLDDFVLLEGELCCRGSPYPHNRVPDCDDFVADGLDERISMTGFIVCAATRAGSQKNIAILECLGGRVFVRFVGNYPGMVLYVLGGALLPFASLSCSVPRGALEFEDNVHLMHGKGACCLWHHSIVFLEGVLKERRYVGCVPLCKVPLAFAPTQTETLAVAIGCGCACAVIHTDGRVVIQTSKPLWGHLCLTGLRWSTVKGEALNFGSSQPQPQQLKSCGLQYLLGESSTQPTFCRVGDVVIGSGNALMEHGCVQGYLPNSCCPLQTCTVVIIGPAGPIWLELHTDGQMRSEPGLTGVCWLTGIMLLVRRDGVAPQAPPRSAGAWCRAPSRSRPQQPRTHIHPSLVPPLNVVLSRINLEEVDSIRQFFQLHETNNKDHITHTTFLGTTDTFCRTGKWCFPDDPLTQAELFTKMARLLELKIPMFVAERFSPVHPWAEDIDIVSDMSGEDSAPTHLVLNTQFLVQRARILFDLIPSLEKASMYVYDSSGWSNKKNAHKVSFHLVFPDILVNEEGGKRIRDTTIKKFVELSSKGGALKRLFDDIYVHSLTNFQRNFGDEASPEHIWSEIFDENSVRPKNGMRLPYNNKADMVDAQNSNKRRLDNRSPKPHGVFTFCREETLHSMSLPDLERPDLTKKEWLMCGSVRRLGGLACALADNSRESNAEEITGRELSCSFAAEQFCSKRATFAQRPGHSADAENGVVLSQPLLDVPKMQSSGSDLKLCTVGDSHGRQGRVQQDFDGKAWAAECGESGGYLTLKRGAHVTVYPHVDTGGGWIFGRVEHASQGGCREEGWLPEEFFQEFCEV